MRLQSVLLNTPEPIPENSADEKWKWFKNYLGALDGTYINVRVPIIDKPRYRSRKGEIATNVLGVCSHDMQFIYILPGWEGSVADGRVLREAMRMRNGLKVPRVHDMLTGPNCSGFGYDNWTGCLVAEKAVWEPYLKPFPHYKQLCIVFGKDRATRIDVETPADVIEDLEAEEQRRSQTDDENIGFGLDGVDAAMSFDDSPKVGVNNESTLKGKKRKKKANHSVEVIICNVMKESTEMLGSKMETSSLRLSMAIEDEIINDLKRKLNGELMKLDGLARAERIKATIAIGKDRDLTQIFFTIDDNDKEDWVREAIGSVE
ncbi:hypothetical protein BUALT_Bualt12G0103900 [Buddleja alternifolia]|uniref:DDE Tnp4 domain-containing protein n=1 Tax=Buddleja alternifolia TaxID=168488 RepID=A0AAV6WQP7_9LAMI|nr:hypothetical protein BUALT_Bualt12G0103900 [Buddleja alternifolia]